MGRFCVRPDWGFRISVEVFTTGMDRSCHLVVVSIISVGVCSPGVVRVCLLVGIYIVSAREFTPEMEMDRVCLLVAVSIFRSAFFSGDGSFVAPGCGFR